MESTLKKIIKCIKYFLVHNIGLPTSSHALEGFTQANHQRSGLDNATTYGFLMPTYLRPSQILGRSLVNHGPLKFVYDYDYRIPSQFCAGIIIMIMIMMITKVFIYTL